MGAQPTASEKLEHLIDQTKIHISAHWNSNSLHLNQEVIKRPAGKTTSINHLSLWILIIQARNRPFPPRYEDSLHQGATVTEAEI